MYLKDKSYDLHIRLSERQMQHLIKMEKKYSLSRSGLIRLLLDYDEMKERKRNKDENIEANNDYIF